VSSSPDLAAPPPSVLPVFPLTGCLLLPGNWLPLNVFEARYRAMVEDVMAGDRHLGIIQPQGTEEWPAELSEQPELHSVGTAGRIDRCEPQQDGRFHILLRGVTRFRIHRELRLLRGYRRVVANYDEFRDDFTEHRIILDPRPILAALQAFSAAHQLAFDLDLLSALPGSVLVNGLATALPFPAEQKQALLEASDLAARHDLLLAMMASSAPPGKDLDLVLPTVH
jgi:Lon protease-like protein